MTTGRTPALGGDPSPLMTPPSVDSRAFRQALSQLAAGVSVVTASDRTGAIYGLTATAVTSLSLAPPLALICVSNRSSMAAVLQAGSTFIVHVLSAEQEWIARQFARPGREKFTGIAYDLSAHACPRI